MEDNDMPDTPLEQGVHDESHTEPSSPKAKSPSNSLASTPKRPVQGVYTDASATPRSTPTNRSRAINTYNLREAEGEEATQHGARSPMAARPPTTCTNETLDSVMQMMQTKTALLEINDDAATQTAASEAGAAMECDDGTLVRGSPDEHAGQGPPPDGPACGRVGLPEQEGWAGGSSSSGAEPQGGGAPHEKAKYKKKKKSKDAKRREAGIGTAAQKRIARGIHK